MVRFGLIGLLFAALAVPSSATTLTPVADSYVRDGSYAATNYGTSSTLFVKASTSAGYNRDSYVKFDISGITGTVATAQVRIYAALASSGSLGVSVDSVPSSSWAESTVTWNNRPALGSLIGSATVTSTSYAWYTVDVTGIIQSEAAAGHGAVTLAFHNNVTSSSNVILISSKETANPAQLVITTGVSAPSVPNPPSGLTATTVSASQINLAWTDNSTNEDGFKVERSTDNAVFTQISTVGPGVVTASDSGLAASKTYYYRVRAYNTSGNSAYSGTASAITGSVTVTNPPAAPSGLTAIAVSSSQINLAWVDASNNESGFDIERSTNNTSFTQIGTTGPGVSVGSDSGLTASTTYYYRVRAFNASGASVYSNTASATTTAAPPPPSGSAFYVSTSGSDSASGSLSSPWRTVKHGLSSIQAGGHLYIRGGTYVERITGISIHQGTASSPITISAYPGERPVVQGLLWLTNPSYWTIDGLNVTWDSATGNASEHMIKMTGGVGWTYKNSEIWGAHSFAAMLIAGSGSQPSNWSVINNCFHDTYPSNSTNQDHLIYANTGLSAGAGLIAHNIMYNATNGEGVKLAGPDSSGGTVNVTVRNNTIYNTSQSILVAWQSHDNQIYDNILYLVRSGNACFRGYQLTGSNNVAHNNIGGGASAMFNNDGTGIINGGGNVFPVNPQFDTISPTGLHPMNSAAQGFGAYAP